MADTLLACPDCGQVHEIPDRGARERRLLCVRCARRLFRPLPPGLDRGLAYTLGCLLLFAVANAFPIFVISLEGDKRSNLLETGVVELFSYGGALAALAIVVAALSIVVPGLRLGLIAAVLISLKRKGGETTPRPLLASAWKLAVHLRPWAMLDVYLLGTFVAYTRVQDMAHVEIGNGGYALAAFVLMEALLESSLGRRRIWDAIGDPGRWEPKRGQGWIQCPDCELVVGTDREAAAFQGVPTCPRCAAQLEPRHVASLGITTALTLAAYVLYLPANFLPVMTIDRFGSVTNHTILGGIEELYTAGMWPLALLVLFASIIVPVLKLIGLTWFLIAIRIKSDQAVRFRTRFYRVIDLVGRWSYIDVFMISILVATIRFGNLSTIEPGNGAVSFAAVVALTMVATHVFDSRLMWDAAGKVPVGEYEQPRANAGNEAGPTARIAAPGWGEREVREQA